MKNLNPLPFLICVCIVTVFWVVIEVIEVNMKFHYIIKQDGELYKTEKIDSISNGTVYFKNLNGEIISVTGNFTIKEINK
jgi:hypothetical protein